MLEIFWPLCFGFSVFVVSVTWMQRARQCSPIDACMRSQSSAKASTARNGMKLSQLIQQHQVPVDVTHTHTHTHAHAHHVLDWERVQFTSAKRGTGQEADVLQGTPALWRSLVAAGWQGHAGSGLCIPPSFRHGHCLTLFCCRSGWDLWRRGVPMTCVLILVSPLVAGFSTEPREPTVQSCRRWCLECLRADGQKYPTLPVDACASVVMTARPARKPRSGPRLIR